MFENAGLALPLTLAGLVVVAGGAYFLLSRSKPAGKDFSVVLDEKAETGNLPTAKAAATTEGTVAGAGFAPEQLNPFNNTPRPKRRPGASVGRFRAMAADLSRK
ncbi:MAG: hypothetical protein ERJ67_10635 [Aphanocapsa feldmannii 277cV]|uniref:Uncharacterized protein n=2 Tax=Aphanocapsa feldmannii TaxID=192050 RepID=A0A524RKU9_9CHRO|nr:MAG: hypothetical protein ERJ69_06355 [Aphanocapsa feldmannii 288cV]TGG90500.1 MAG: hypothetical protein ERJ67_10635 [Aphanocapsa feldmannii 277cV]TGH27558.1 MAG: hypothetical protein ERJ68_00895 [Aphanocapsa feldmannii 277cI]